MKIESRENKYVKFWNSLHQKKARDASGLFLAEGEHLVQEALKAGAVETLLYTGSCPFEFDHCIELSESVMAKIADAKSSVSVMAVCRKSETLPRNAKRLLLLDGIQDPGNFGTLVRTAVSFGFDGIYCSPDCCDLYNEKTVRSTQGAMFFIPVVRGDLVTVVKQLKEDGFTVYGTALKNAVSLRNVQAEEKMAFVLGSEGNGVSGTVLSACDASVFIEMHDFESLNVAVAGGILLYQFRKEK